LVGGEYVTPPPQQIEDERIIRELWERHAAACTNPDGKNGVVCEAWLLAQAAMRLAALTAAGGSPPR
jgi:hypothetical protein